MLIAHLPAAYLVHKAILPHLNKVAFLTGAVLPDIDMLWFYTLGARATHHHNYLTHRPVLWAALALLGLALRHRPRAALTALAFGALLHLALDSLTGQIAWAWPLSAHTAPLITVPASQPHWILSFLLHPSFLLELALCLAAALTALRARKNPAR